MKEEKPNTNSCPITWSDSSNVSFAIVIHWPSRNPVCVLVLAGLVYNIFGAFIIEQQEGAQTILAIWTIRQLDGVRTCTRYTSLFIKCDFRCYCFPLISFASSRGVWTWTSVHSVAHTNNHVFALYHQNNNKIIASKFCCSLDAKWKREKTELQRERDRKTIYFLLFGMASVVFRLRETKKNCNENLS